MLKIGLVVLIGLCVVMACGCIGASEPTVDIQLEDLGIHNSDRLTHYVGMNIFVENWNGNKYDNRGTVDYYIYKSKKDGTIDKLLIKGTDRIFNGVCNVNQVNIIHSDMSSIHADLYGDGNITYGTMHFEIDDIGGASGHEKLHSYNAKNIAIKAYVTMNDGTTIQNTKYFDATVDPVIYNNHKANVWMQTRI